MRKGRLRKEKNYTKNSIDWSRYSYDGKENWIETQAYLDAHNMKTYCGLAEGNSGKKRYSFQRGFTSLEEAFEWAESQVDYKTGKVKEGL